jgi:hypothetical protein
MLRYSDDGCLADDGPLVTYEDYRTLEVADAVFQQKVNRVLKVLTSVPELDVAGGGSVAARDLDDAINDAIGQLEKAFSERTD